MAKPIKEFAKELSDAYSTDRYSRGWSASIRALRNRGYDDRQIEAIIRSKYTRWAADQVTGSRKANATDLLDYLDESMSPRDLEELVKQTF
jgi:hypothetical protein